MRLILTEHRRGDCACTSGQNKFRNKPELIFHRRRGGYLRGLREVSPKERDMRQSARSCKAASFAFHSSLCGGEVMIFEPQHRCGTKGLRLVWVVLCVWMQLGLKTNHTYLSNPSLTALLQTHKDTRRADPKWRDLLYTQLNVFDFFETTCGRLGLKEAGQPCPEDNLSRTIWSRLSFFFSSLCHERRREKCVFCGLEMQFERHIISVLLQLDDWETWSRKGKSFTASQASRELHNLYLYYYWSLPVASAHLDAPAIPLPSRCNRCWHRKFNLDILVMMKVVVIGLNWAWQECDIATAGLYSMNTTLKYTVGGMQPAGY